MARAYGGRFALVIIGPPGVANELWFDTLLELRMAAIKARVAHGGCGIAAWGPHHRLLRHPLLWHVNLPGLDGETYRGPPLFPEGGDG